MRRVSPLLTRRCLPFRAEALRRADAPLAEENSLTLPTPSTTRLWRFWSTPAVRGVLTVAVFLCAALLTPLAARAGRTGGRVGGSSFPRSTSRSSSFPTRTSSTWSSPRRSVVTQSYFFPVYGVGVGGGSIFSLVFYAFAAYLLFSAVQRWRGDEWSDDDDDEDVVADRASVCKVQVGLLGLARRLQSDLDAIARRADTSTPSGLHYVLQAEVKRARNLDRAERGFNQMSMRERGKIKEETLSNWEGRRAEKAAGLAKQDIGNELIVVTILVAAVGTLSLPAVRSKNDLNAALNKSK